jgi:tetratricopeptide (TPR) repeat protein
VEFEQHIRAGRLPEAMELYRGPFAPGFHLSDAPELERWIEATRARLAGHAYQASSLLSVRLAESEPAVALEWAKRAYEVDHTDAALRRVIALQDALGDRVGAIREYELFARRTRAELDVEPSPETLALVEAIRSRAEPGGLVERLPTPRSIPTVEYPRQAKRRRPLMIVAGVAAIAIVAAAVSFTSGTWRGMPNDRVTTDSKEALAAYRDGERALGAGRYEAAVDLFRRAAAADSSFAMANYRLSIAANWTGQSGLANSAANRADSLAESLPTTDRTRIVAWVAYLRGDMSRANRLYTEMLEKNTRDFDATFYLAEIQFHSGPSFGSPAEASASLWNRVLSLDGSNAGAIIHLMRIAAMEGDSSAFESLARRLTEIGPSPDHEIELRAIRAFTFGDSALRAASAAEIRSVDVLRRSVVREAVLSARDMNGAGKVLLPVLMYGHGFASWEQGEFLLGAQIEAATGQMDAALATIDSAALLQPDRALEYKAMMVSLPGIGPSRARTDVRRAMERPPSPGAKYVPAQGLRDYFGSVLALRDGDMVEARRKLAALQSRAVASVTPEDSTLNRHVDRLRRIAAAEILRAEGRLDSALAVLGTPVEEPDRRIPYVWSYPRAEERFLRGDLLEATGKRKEALAWFSTFPDPSAYDLAYLPAALERRLSLATSLGDSASARIARMRLSRLK